MRNIQAAADAYYDARQRFFEVEAAKPQAVEEEAENIASAIVGSFERLSGFVDRGQMCLHEVRITHGLETRSAEEWLLYAVADSRRPGSRFAALAFIADGFVEQLAETADVREQAETNVLRGEA